MSTAFVQAYNATVDMMARVVKVTYISKIHSQVEMTDKIDAWWFAASDSLPNGDNRKIIIGGQHSVNGKIVICKHALHASRHPYDALQYAPGNYLYKVRVWGDVVEQSDKLGARNREYLEMRDATEMLRGYAREMALSVAHLWDAPEVVLEYLRTGDETLRERVEVAAEAAVRAAEAAWAEAARAEAARAEAARAAVWAAAEAARAEAARAAVWAAVARAAARAAEAAARAAEAGGAAITRDRFSDLVDELFAQ